MTEMEAHHEILTDLLDAEYLRTEFGDRHFLAKEVTRRFWPNLVPEQRAEGERRVATVLRELQDAGTIYRIGSTFRVWWPHLQASPEPAVSTSDPNKRDNPRS